MDVSITHNPLRCGGRATVGPTRVTVHDIVDSYHTYDRDLNKLLAAYPHWTAEQVQAALAYYGDHGEEIDAVLTARREDFERHRQARG